MANNYLKNNLIANQISVDTFKLYENQDVDNALKISVNTLLELYKKISFDLASNRNRKFSTFSTSLTSVMDSTSVKSLVAKIKDICGDMEIADPVLAPLKKMYLDSINIVADAIKRMVELDPSLEAKCVEYFKSASKKLIASVKGVAEDYEKKLNESMVIGFPGRIDRLNVILMNLMTDSKGKDAKSGYGRDWHRLFTTLSQKLSAINGNKASFSDNERKSLAELEKKSDSLSQEYNQYKVKAMEMAMAKIMKDDDLANKFGDFNEIMTNALDQVTKANTEEGIIEVKVREDLEDKETKMHDRVFPLKMGDRDSDAKLKGSGIITSIQKALIDAFVPIKNLLDPRGGANGKFESGTSVAIKSIQSSLGNKEVSGKIDKPLLDAILKLDQISTENKDAIRDAISKLRESYTSLNESSVALSRLDFIKLMEAMTYIDPADIESKIGVYSEELEEDNNSMVDPKTSEALMAESLAKLLRTKDYNKNAEAEDFLREDGTLKGSCPPEFIDAWTKAISGDKNVSFFFIEDEDGKGGLYATKRLSSNMNKPCNWNKYKSIAGEDNEDVDKFGNWYTSYWKNLGGVSSDIKSKVIDDVMTSNCKVSRDEKLDDICTIYEGLEESFVSNKEEISCGYLRPSSMKKITESIRGIIGNDNISKLNPEELRSLYNTAILISPLMTYSKSDTSWVPAISKLCEELNMSEDEMISEIKRNGSLGKNGRMSSEKVAYFNTDTLQEGNDREILKSTILGSTPDAEKVAKMKSSLDKIKPITKSLNKHSKRMCMSSANDITPDISDSIVVISFAK